MHVQMITGCRCRHEALLEHAARAGRIWVLMVIENRFWQVVLFLVLRESLVQRLE